MKTNKTVFIEYSTARKNQHFMTVVQVVDGKRIIIGRIFREYDAEKKKTFYTAKAWEGSDIFFDTHELTALKKKFIEHGKGLAMAIPKDTVSKDRKDFPLNSEKTSRKPAKEKTGREKELNQVRQKNAPVTEKEQEIQKEINRESEQGYEKTGKTFSKEKSGREEELRQIREHDAPETEKDLETQEEISQENEQQNNQETDTSNDEQSEREQEIEDIRDRDDDQGRDHDMER